MAVCEKCGNEYDRTFEVRMNGDTHVFDSFECAIETLAPTCNTCGVRVVGHGVQAGGEVYCCANCARQAGHQETRDRA